MKILVLNAGSSSQKSCLFDLQGKSLPDRPPDPVWKAHIDWTVKSGTAVLTVKANGETVETELESSSKKDAIAEMLATLTTGKTRVLDRLSEIETVGHRVVHGGSDYSDAVVVTSEVKDAIDRLSILAPAHNRVNLEGIEAIEQVLENVPQVAVFDTGFHSQMPQAAKMYPLPKQWYDRGIRRYGFHGISHDYCTRRTAQILGRDLEDLKIITCHLGNGCSLAAVRHGKSIETTMGFTPLEGLMMGTRSGSIDPAIPLYLMRQHGLDIEEVERLLEKESGLKGVSGISSDWRSIREALQKGDDNARLTLDLYVHRLVSNMGAMLTSLGGVDAISFTGGVGEHAPEVRQLACEKLAFLGVELDGDRNQSSPEDEEISTSDSAVRVLVISAREEWAIARECWQLQH